MCDSGLSKRGKHGLLSAQADWEDCDIVSHAGMYNVQTSEIETLVGGMVYASCASYLESRSWSLTDISSSDCGSVMDESFFYLESEA